ncbi:MAG: hypothetical protein NTW87_19865 [Planctomycetota bacterium]|nr:hypothetical protein [Planctomycetota bacterium]
MRYTLVVLLALCSPAIAAEEGAKDGDAAKLEALAQRVERLEKLCEQIRAKDNAKTEASEAVQATQARDIASSAKNINQLDRKLVYVEKIIHERLANIDADVNGLKTDTTGLKKDQMLILQKLKALEEAQAEAKK